MEASQCVAVLAWFPEDKALKLIRNTYEVLEKERIMYFDALS